VTAPTEQRNPRSMELDRLSAGEIVELMNQEEQAALEAVERSAPEIAATAEDVAAAYEDGGRILYLGAGTSGLLALVDALEMPATFGVEQERFGAMIAGPPLGSRAVITQAEDDADAAAAALENAGFGPADAVIGLAASGTTPFVVAGVRHARARGCRTCGIANNPGTPLLEAGARSILLDTGPEVLTGSTRLKAGTAQKLTLNRISTTAMVRAGRVVSNLMVELSPKTEKLRDRCVRIVSVLGGVDETRARQLLTAEDWSIRAALRAAGHESV
jgi:N-acetylmuramic acid 6-phosphate etherase